MRVCGWRPVCTDCLVLVLGTGDTTRVFGATQSSWHLFVRAGVDFWWVSQDIIAKTAVAGNLLLDVCAQKT